MFEFTVIVSGFLTLIFAWGAPLWVSGVNADCESTLPPLV